MRHLAFFYLFTSFFLPQPCQAATKPISISATIGQKYFTLDGYTSPDSPVYLTTPHLTISTQSDQSGYFQIRRSLISTHIADLCLSSIDSHNRQSTPVCVPAPPATRYYTHIGPIILPPTLTINSAKIKPRSTTLSSGQSIPNSTIDIYLYKTNNEAKSFPRPAHAYSLPVFTTQSNNLGNFNFNLPTAYASNYRLFATVKYQDHNSPKSNTLLYTLPSLLWLFWQQNFLLILAIPFLLTLAIFTYLLYHHYHPTPHLSAVLPQALRCPTEASDHRSLALPQHASPPQIQKVKN